LSVWISSESGFASFSLSLSEFEYVTSVSKREREGERERERERGREREREREGGSVCEVSVCECVCVCEQTSIICRVITFLAAISRHPIALITCCKSFQNNFLDNNFKATFFFLSLKISSKFLTPSLSFEKCMA